VFNKIEEVLPTPNAAAQPTESGFAALLADILGVDEVPTHSHFFDDLDADSMVMARFCAKVRKRDDLPAVSMKDIYRYPTINGLASALDDPPSATREEAPSSATAAPAQAAEPSQPAGKARYVLCGTLQLLTFLASTLLGGLVVTRGYTWVEAAPGLLDLYLRAALLGAALFVALCVLPILAKWTLIGRWKPRRIRIWSLGYFRFWLVKTLVRTSPLALFAGSPLQVLYLRALGAHIGRGTVIFTRNLPVCTDLLTIGAGTVVRKDTFLNCYRADTGCIEIGSVTLGSDVYVGQASVVDIGTSMGDGAQLGHSSALHPGQAVPAGECWNGVPAQRSGADYRVVAPARCGTIRRTVYSIIQLVPTFGVYLPVMIAGVDVILVPVPKTIPLLGAGPSDMTGWTFYLDALAVATIAFFGLVLIGLVFVGTVPRLLNLALKPGKVYRLYGLHYSLHRAIGRMTNIRFFPQLFGDSSYIVHYLRYLGYHLTPVEQTGSNFGMEVRHENPYLATVGTGTMVADGLSIINTDFSSTSFRMAHASIGPRNFLGNNVVYPAQGKTGENCLLATKVLVPIDGELRENTGLLGAPSFAIPRSVQRDKNFDHLAKGDELRRGLAAKNRYNLRTIGLVLLARWIYVLGVVMLAKVFSDAYRILGLAGFVAEVVGMVLFSTVYFMLLERTAARFRTLQPKFCSIYDPYFWWHERFWKFVIPTSVDRRWVGTPFRNVRSRLLGVRIGKRVFDDGCIVHERPLTTIGDDCMLNAGSAIQCHSQEDGSFKSDRSSLDAGCALGVGALIHYGVTVGEGSSIAANSFLMKGEEVPSGSGWAGNPAAAVTPASVLTELGAAPERKRPTSHRRRRRRLTSRLHGARRSPSPELTGAIPD
jgi:non-ribosomal peptide synthetase-like protein